MLVLYNSDFFCWLQYILKIANFIKKEFYLLFWSCTKKKLGKFILMSILQIIYLAKTIGSSHWKCWHKIFFVEHIQDPHFWFCKTCNHSIQTLNAITHINLLQQHYLLWFLWYIQIGIIDNSGKSNWHVAITCQLFSSPVSYN